MTFVNCIVLFLVTVSEVMDGVVILRNNEEKR